MKDLEKILKKLEEFESNEDKIDFLYSLLEELDDEDLVNDIKKIIKTLEEGLENKLEIDVPLRKIAREIDFDESELDVEQIQRGLSQGTPGRPDLAIRNQDNEDLSFNYSGSSNYSTASLYSPTSFDYQTLQNSFDNDFMKQSVVRENILNPENVITEVEKENLNKKLRESMPGASEERILMYQAKLTDELKKDEKAKYIARLK